MTSVLNHLIGAALTGALPPSTPPAVPSRPPPLPPINTPAVGALMLNFLLAVVCLSLGLTLLECVCHYYRRQRWGDNIPRLQELRKSVFTVDSVFTCTKV